jgi:hypothetical protein
VEDIREAIDAQFTCAMQSGIAGRVEALQKASGIRDMFAAPWIKSLLMRFSALQREKPNISLEATERELRAWLDTQPGLKRNPLLDVPGEPTFVENTMQQLTQCMRRFRPSPRHTG